MTPHKPMGVATGQIYRGQKPTRDPNYLKFIRSLPSAVSGRGGCDACHTGPHGLGQKSSDLATIPLTRKEHREFDANPRAFCEMWSFDLPALITRLNAAYQIWKGKRAA